jgi:TPR repeat protein
MKNIKLKTIAFFVISLLLHGCATNKNYQYVKVFEADISFEKANAQCRYESNIQNRADARVDKNGSIGSALLRISDSTESLCMKRFGYSLEEVHYNTDKFNELKLSAENGKSTDQIILAYDYLMGLNTNQSSKDALKWYRIVVENQNNSGDTLENALLNIGNIYEQGLEVNKNYEIALMWYFLAGPKSQLGVLKINALGLKMTSQQIEKSRSLARECVLKKYKYCD